MLNENHLKGVVALESRLGYFKSSALKSGLWYGWGEFKLSVGSLGLTVADCSPWMDKLLLSQECINWEVLLTSMVN